MDPLDIQQEYVHKEIPKVNIQAVEHVVEVPSVVHQERPVEVPQIQHPLQPVPDGAGTESEVDLRL